MAVPYLLGIFAVRGSVSRADLLLLAGLYAGFIGRIVLKDFRDVRGDALFGKRTFLVRHGRRATCRLSAAFLVAGVSVLPFVRDVSVALIAAYAVFLGVHPRVAGRVGALDERAPGLGAHRGDRHVSAAACSSRSTRHFAMVAVHWSLAAISAMTVALAVLVTGTAFDVLRSGALTNTFVPPGFAPVPRPRTDAS